MEVFYLFIMMYVKGKCLHLCMLVIVFPLLVCSMHLACSYCCTHMFCFWLSELKRSLYALFSQYGRILDVVALKTAKLCGQAWIVFSDVTAASNAVRQMQNFPFYEKPMVSLQTLTNKMYGYSKMLETCTLALHFLN